ncbi:hypothetical protein VNO80_21058 [Phaseolus coccineus]|uniref:Encoded peptide n=1 Tax=Phaseolus coccineus TaxID=3886 RepID=A0AAN9M764_PHACN
MARNKFIFTMIFFSLIIFCQRFHSTEGRHLKHNQVHNDVHGGISATNAATFKNVAPLTPSTMVGATLAAPPPGRGVEDFRPTTPGHSPGVGHSVHS